MNLTPYLQKGISFSRDEYPHHFTASGFVYHPDTHSLLLLHHRKLNKWLQPGGHIEKGENPITAARREISEETGLAFDKLQLFSDEVFDFDVHEIPASTKEPRHFHHDFRFLFLALTQTLVKNEESNELRWVNLSEIGDWTTEESILRPVQKIKHHLQRQKVTKGILS